ncbi:MAG TPA: hypothetical protein VIM16_23680 [Mucilaginibacter sp.]
MAPCQISTQCVEYFRFRIDGVELPHNLESINAVLIHQGKTQPERLLQLNTIAIIQMRSLLNSKQIKNLK